MRPEDRSQVWDSPQAWGCEHPLPIEIVPAGKSGRRARCLRCGQCGPVRPDCEGAMLALRNEARVKGEGGSLILATYDRGPRRWSHNGVAT